MSSNKSVSLTPRQVTLMQMNQFTLNKTSKSNLPESKKKTSTSTRTNPNNNQNKKHQIHEIINLEQEDFLGPNSMNIGQSKNEEAFVF